MLMQVSSGLTRYQVKKATQHLQHDNALASPVFQLRPLLLLVAGCSLLLVVMQDWAIAVVSGALLVSMSLLAHRSLRRWFAQFSAHDQVVLVVRGGLTRLVRVDQLVVGDTLFLQAGQLLPVDVTLTAGLWATPSKPLAMLLRLTGVAKDDTVGFAGSVIDRDGLATVTALGCDRFIASVAAPALAERQSLSLAPVLRLLFWGAVARTVQLIGQLPHAVSVHVHQMLSNVQAKIDQRQLIKMLSALLARMSLVGYVRHQAKEAAFRYNQEPVSWRFV